MRRLILSLAMAIAASRPTAAEIVSTFDLDAEGWTVADLVPNLGNPPTVQATYAPVHHASEGAPGGYLEFSDPIGGPWFFFAASDAFLGDRGSYYGGRIAAQLRVTASDGSPYPLAILVGAGMTLFHVAPPPATSWTSYAVDLAPGAWRVNDYANGPDATEAQLRAVLAGLAALYINGDWLSGVETAGLDEVRLSAVPEPGGLALAATALALAGLARRRPGSAQTRRNVFVRYR